MRGYVYFIGPEALLHRECTVVKIGYTSGNPRARLSTLQTGSPEWLVLWAYTPGDPELERAFHQTFANLRSHGEWFFVQRKLRHFLSHLGNEPDIGNLIPREQLEVAIYDNIFCPIPAEPDLSAEEWLSSGEPDYLAYYFPELWAEAGV